MCSDKQIGWDALFELSVLVLLPRRDHNKLVTKGGTSNPSLAVLPDGGRALVPGTSTSLHSCSYSHTLITMTLCHVSTITRTPAPAKGPHNPMARAGVSVHRLGLVQTAALPFPTLHHVLAPAQPNLCLIRRRTTMVLLHQCKRLPFAMNALAAASVQPRQVI